jgi:hypothetical protein
MVPVATIVWPLEMGPRGDRPQVGVAVTETWAPDVVVPWAAPAAADGDAAEVVVVPPGLAGTDAGEILAAARRGATVVVGALGVVVVVAALAVVVVVALGTVVVGALGAVVVVVFGAVVVVVLALATVVGGVGGAVVVVGGLVVVVVGWATVVVVPPAGWFALAAAQAPGAPRTVPMPMATRQVRSAVPRFGPRVFKVIALIVISRHYEWLSVVRLVGKPRRVV